MPTPDPPIQPPVIPERRRHQSPDIIDIDALDADDVVYVGSARPSQRRRVGEDGRAVPITREVIHVTDSEDDDIEFIGRTPARPQPPLVGRHRIFSPPPPPQIDAIPPVPHIPERFLPLRQRPPLGPIIPDEDPLPFEADLRPPLPAEQPWPAAAPPSHHAPSMGFGGALLAGVRRIIAPRNPPQRHEPRNSWGVSGSFVMRWDPFDFAGGEEDELLDRLDIGLFGEEDNHVSARRVRSQLTRALNPRDHDRAEPDYKPEYTHPDPPQPGFTHDFSHLYSPSPAAEEDAAAPSRLASGSGARFDVSLVCAACRDPLVAGASDVGDDRAKRKLWGLRCGHLLDGKCIEKLMKPVLPTPDTSGSSTRNVTESRRYPPPSQDSAFVGSSSSRTRTRPRRGMPVPLTSAPHGSRGRRGAATHRSNRKGKGKMKAPVVEAEHEWSCPVSGCGCAHLSLLMDDGWMMDEKRGATAVFV